MSRIWHKIIDWREIPGPFFRKREEDLPSSKEYAQQGDDDQKDSLDLE
jgi:hypothetical protein